MATQYPEKRVLIIMTGGTICMRTSPEGLVPARGFLEAGMKPRPSFNDGSEPGMCDVFGSRAFRSDLPSGGGGIEKAGILIRIGDKESAVASFK